MKRSEIAPAIYNQMDTVSLLPVRDGGLSIPIRDLAALSLIPWFCDVSIQWAVRIKLPAADFKKSPFRRVNGTISALIAPDTILIGVPGDGINPSTYCMVPLAEAIQEQAMEGMTIELASANLGIVKRDSEAPAETRSDCGNQRYAGVVDRNGNWHIAATTLQLDAQALDTAIGAARMFVDGGPWRAGSEQEAQAALKGWLVSPQANVNPLVVKTLVRYRDGAFTTLMNTIDSKLYGLALGFFRERLKTGPFSWDDSQPYPIPEDDELDSVAAAVFG
jgi:hypothetical protein